MLPNCYNIVLMKDVLLASISFFSNILGKVFGTLSQSMCPFYALWWDLFLFKLFSDCSHNGDELSHILWSQLSKIWRQLKHEIRKCNKDDFKFQVKTRIRDILKAIQNKLCVLSQDFFPKGWSERGKKNIHDEKTVTQTIL